MGLRANATQAQPYDEFEAMRRRAKQQQQSNTQQAQQQVERNFARFGGLNTGAFTKQQQLVEDAANKQAADVEEQISGAQMQEKKRKDEILQNREFQSSEAQKQRDFASVEEKLGREFASNEAKTGRDFQRELTNQDLTFRDKVFNAENTSRLRQMDIQQQQFDKSYALEKDAQEFNKMMAKIEAGKPTDLLGSLLGPAFSMGVGQNSIFAPITGALGSVGGLFCFVEGTPVKMEDGSIKRIEEINIGDKCAIGGEVYSKGHAVSHNIFNLHSIFVTGLHAFYDQEDKKWRRVSESPLSTHLQGHKSIVYFLSNEKHRILVNNVLFADYDETDLGPVLNLQESLLALNEEA